MRFVIEMDDFYFEEEDQERLKNTLVHHIIATISNQIQSSIKDRVEKQITMEVKTRVESEMYRMITAHIKDVVESGKIPNGKDKDGILLSDYIKNMFVNNTGYKSPDVTIKEQAKVFGDQMKARYDLLFASQLVAKMHENNMLKDDVAKLLLEK